MAYGADLTAREAEIIRVLNVLTSQTKEFIVIGGYAVNAFTSHRFSVDFDLVISEKDLPLFGQILSNEGYARRRTVQRRRISDGKIQEYVKLIGGRRVTADLFMDTMVCRQTGGPWSYELLKQNSFETNITGLTDSAVARVPKRELLIAMKIHSARGADLRDVIMLSETAAWEAVAEFATCGAIQKVIKQVEDAIETICKKDFQSALKAGFGLRSDVTPLISRTAKGLNTVKKVLSSSM